MVLLDTLNKILGNKNIGTIYIFMIKYSMRKSKSICKSYRKKLRVWKCLLVHNSKSLHENQFKKSQYLDIGFFCILDIYKNNLLH